MTLKTKIASVVLFIIVTTAQFWTGFYLTPTITNCWTIAVISLGMVLVLVTNISVWLKLFLLVTIAHTIYAVNPEQTTLCLNGIVCFAVLYYGLTKIKPVEIMDLVKVVLIMIGIQAVWIMVEVLYVIKLDGFFNKNPDLCGTIGYVNLVALLIASTIPLMILYRKSLLIFALPALWFCGSYGSLGALAVSMWVFCLEKSKRFIVFTLVVLGIVCYFGIPKLKTDVRTALWRSTIQQQNKENLIYGIGLGSFKDYPLVNVERLRQGLEIEIEKGNKDAELVLPFTDDIRFFNEHRMINLQDIFKPLENGQARFEELRKELKPWMDNNVAYRAHNTFLNLLREGGIVVLAPLLGFMLMTVVNFIRSEKTLPQKALFASLCGFYIGCVFDFPDRNLPTMFIFLIILAANTMLVKRKERYSGNKIHR